MNRPYLTLATIALALTAPTVAHAGEPVVQAVQLGNESIRYDNGVPTMDLVQSRGAVQIVPLGRDHGSYVFGVVVFNASNVHANFDIGNISAQVGAQPVGIFTINELISRAKTRSAWSQVGIAVIGGLGAAVAASQRDTYRTKYQSRWGTSYSSFSTPSLAGQIQSVRIQEGTVGSLMQMRAQLDETRAQLGDEIVQMTTVSPGGSYAGKIILEKLKSPTLPQPITISVDWNGEYYHFAFQIAKSGTPAPAFTPMPFQPLPQTASAVFQPERPPMGQTQQVAYSEAPMTGRPARDISASAVQPAATTHYITRPQPAPMEAAYIAPTGRALPGGLVEVPMKPAPWASKIDPWTGNVVPIDPATLGSLVAAN